ncbi:hypothetical protein ES703_108304 [subsurface metagenome]
MKKSVLRKIIRVEQFYPRYKTRDGVKKCGPYWRGMYWENGRTITVYLGKELPDSLGRLLEGRYKRHGYKNYAWPGRAK